MKNVREICLHFFQNEDIRKEIREIVRPIVSVVYNELYLYIWFICLYNVALIFITLANLFLLLKIYSKRKQDIL